MSISISVIGKADKVKDFVDNAIRKDVGLEPLQAIKLKAEELINLSLAGCPKDSAIEVKLHVSMKKDEKGTVNAVSVMITPIPGFLA